MDLLTKFRLPCRRSVAAGKNNERTISEIPVHTISPSPYQPRKFFDSDSIEELSSSIKKYGVLQPITVRKLSEENYELIAGERRLRACSACGMLKIPAIVIDLSDNDSAVVALVENIQRENLNFIEEAEAYRNLLYHHGFTQEELAAKLGKTQSSVANKIRLLKLSAVVREIICDNFLTERHARTLLRLKSQEEQLAALEKITSQGMNVQQSEALIEEMLSEAAAPKKEETEEPEPEPARQGIKLIHKKSLKDVRIFLNTVRRAISVMQENGIGAESTETEHDTYYEYTIRIPKNHSNTEF